MLYINRERLIDTVRWWGKYAWHAGSLPDKSWSEYQFIDSLKQSFEQKYGQTNEIEEDPYELKMWWAKIKTTKSVAAFVKITGEEIALEFIRSAY